MFASNVPSGSRARRADDRLRRRDEDGIDLARVDRPFDVGEVLQLPA
jgi:hypothetical protein